MQYEYSATKDSWLQEAMFAKDKQKYLSEWRKHYETMDSGLNLNQFEFIPNSPDNALKNLPQFSFMLRVPFKLQKPYLSKEDRAFHILDNPVRKDKVFQTPMVAPTSWKGALRAALWQLEYKEESEQIIRLFGNEREQEDHKKLKSGRLYFYPTFFDKIGLEVINPHDRQKGTSAHGPIYLECVPIGTRGELVILYVPFGKVEKKQVLEDLELVVKGVKEMLTVYGFGAKTSSGFGIGEIYKSEDFPSKEEYHQYKLKQNQPYSEKIYENAKANYEREKIPLPTVHFGKSSDVGDRAQEIAQNLSNPGS